MIKTILRAGAFAFFVVFSLALALLPLGLAKAIGAFAGWLLYRFWGSRRRIAIENLKEAVSRGAIVTTEPLEKIALGCFENLGVSFVELVKIYYGLGGSILKGVSYKGLENYRAAASAGRGVIFITAHAGNWELLALKSGMEIGPLQVVARPLDNPFLNRFLERARARYGNSIIYKKGAIRALLGSLKAGGFVGILMDQAVLREEGHIVEFLGRGACTTRMPVLLAKRSGAAIFPAFIKRTSSGHEITVYPETDLSGTEEAALRRLNQAIEQHVKENPSEWLWIHKRWKRVVHPA